MTKLQLLDLFSGIGGFSLGLERTGGFETVAFCEIEEFPRKILAKHWPEVPIYGDIRELTAARLRADGIAIDAIAAGFPCQDISTAGKGAGIEGERSGLWSEAARLIGELRPRVAFLENVAALLSNGMGRVLGDLVSLGYRPEWHCIPASAVGAPIGRDRVWIVAQPAGGSKDQSGAGRNLLGLQRELLQARGRPHDCPDKSGIPRIADGVSRRFHRVAAIGNAVHPRIPELLGRAWLEANPCQ